MLWTNWLFGLIRFALRNEQEEEILGDLCEEWEERRENGEPWFGWLLGQSILLVTLSLSYRLGPRSRRRGPRRKRTGPPRAREPDGWLRTIRVSFRSVTRRPGYAALVILTFATGIGATTALFSVVYGALLKPLPYPDSDGLIRFGERGVAAAPDAIWSISVANYLDLDREARSFQGLAAYSSVGFNLSGRGLPQRIRGLRVTHDFFDVLGLPPAFGRDFAEEDDVEGAEPVVMLSTGLWQRLFGGDPEVLGRELTLDGISHRIVGVASEEFVFPFPFDTQLWLPFAWTGEQRVLRRSRWIEGIGRVSPGTPREAGTSELSVLFAGLTEEHPGVNADRTIGVKTLDGWITGSDTPRRLLLFSGASLLVLLIACANVVNLGLSRAEGRRRELAVRAALGSGRLRLTGLLLSESVLLALAGGVLGTLLAVAGTDLLLVRLGQWIPRATDIGLNGPVLLFALGTSLVAGCLVGIVPALRLPMGNLQSRLGDGRSEISLGPASTRRALVVVELALSLVLLAGAGVLSQSLWRLSQVDMGVEGEGVVSFSLSLPAGKYPDREASLAFFDAALESLRQIPGVAALGAQNRALFDRGGNGPVAVFEEPNPGFRGFMENREITRGLFETLGMRMLQGRPFSSQDRDAGGVAIVNEAFVRTVLGDTPPLGRRFAPQGSEGPFTIVGVVSDVRDGGPEQAPLPTAYYPHGAGPWGYWPYLVAMVRSSGDPLELVPALRRRIAELDPEVPLAEVTTLEARRVQTLGSQRLTAAFLFNLFGALALLLGTGGVYSVMAFTVTQRMREMGLRRALGASGREIIQGVVGQGLALTGIGVAIGFPGVVALRRVLSELLFEISALDAATLAGVAALLAGTAVLACWLPARRAARVDPMTALRQD